NPKSDMIWVALAGPASNFFQAFLWGLALVALHAFSVDEVYFYDVAQAGILVNLVMFVFNLFPLPPLDGGRILVGLLPVRQAIAVSRVEPYGFFIVMALVLTGIVSNFWLSPLMAVSMQVLKVLLSPFQMLL
ncbi:MAG: site-2 protease family protein, partial [Thiomonas sp.]|nr:site-2 protease family protein [Thiomonas sp.]